MSHAKKESNEFVFRSVGNGKAPQLTLAGSMQTWRRADILNHREAVNLRMRQQFLARQANIQEERRRRLAARLQDSLDVLRAYHSVIQNEYRIDDFETLSWGYRNPDPAREPERFQRFVYETKIYHAGFSVQTLRREVNRRLQEMKPDHIRGQARARRIEQMKKHCRVELFDRKKSLSAILDEQRRNRGVRGQLRLPPIVKKKPDHVRTPGEDTDSQDDDQGDDSDDDDGDDEK